MAPRYNSYYGQLLKDTELDAIGDGLEQADWNIVADHGLVGITSGGDVSEHSPTPNLTVDVPVTIAYDAVGKRIRTSGTQNVNVSVDDNDVSTAVATPGNEKVVSVYAVFARDESEPWMDQNGMGGFWNQAESFEFFVKQGAESAPPATPPALEADKVLLCDIRRLNPQTAILNSHISGPGGTWVPTYGERRQDAFVLSSGSLSVREGTAEEADQSILDIVETLTDASGIQVASSGTWHDGTFNPADDLQDRIDKIISDLAGETTGLSGAGGGGMVGHFALPSWTNGGGTPRARPAQSVVATLVDIQQHLEAQGPTGDDGAIRIGSEARTGATVNLSVGTVASQLQEIIGELGGLSKNNTWTGTAEFDAPVNFDSSVDVNSPAPLRINSGASLQVLSGGTMSLYSGSIANVSSVLNMSGSNAGIAYRTGTLGDANANLDVGTDEYRFTTPPATTPKTYTLLDTTGNVPDDGQRIRVIMPSAGNQDAIFVRETGGTEIGRIQGLGRSGTIEFTYHATGNGWYTSSVGEDGSITAHT